MQVLYWSLLVIGVLATFYTFALYIEGNKGWFKSDIGKLLLSMSGGVVLFYLWYLYLMIFPGTSSHVRAYVRLALFVLLTLIIVWRAVIMTKIRLVARNENLKQSKSD